MLKQWKKNNTFQVGPPFATGLPHYGHILAGTIKDIVTRYAHQTGHHVERRFGWDCHGLPVEHEIDKKLGIKTKEDVMEMGIDRYNAECRSIVMRYSGAWRDIVTRCGRWIDFDNDYKTLDTSFMESVWWVFKQLFEKKLVYRGFKVMPYSTACTTPLSNFETQQNYQDVRDPSVIVSFPVVGGEETVHLLAWTTTPWTLPSNVALCVNPKFTYVKLKDNKRNKIFIMAKSRLSFLYRDHKLVGLRYEPLFDFFKDWVGAKNDAFRVVSDDYVTDDGGTGIVHQAPAFGEDDYRVCMKYSIIKRGEPLVCPVDDNGMYTDEVGPDLKGKHVKSKGPESADSIICRKLKDKGRLILKETFDHPYPFCWRSDTPLIYRAVPSWFVNVPKIRDDLVDNNKSTKWVPEEIGSKRFHNWLANARDWAVSRNRYWGTPIPVWTSEDGKQVVVIGSIKELEEKSGKTGITDLHRDNIDDITIPDPRGDKFPALKRTSEVFDCWFESGSMPYGQLHYPFENKERFEKQLFPADFIAEGLDQTRGWFYTLMVISTALFGKPAFKNVIVNGLVLAADGKKMSKRLKNYPDPKIIIDSYGADALRLYLINSPVVRAQEFRFKEPGVKDVVKGVILPWYHAMRFFIENARRYEAATSTKFKYNGAIYAKTERKMDKWILQRLNDLVKTVRAEMEKYHLYTVIPALVLFIDDLTNKYVRFNRDRMKAVNGDQNDALMSLQTLHFVLLKLCRLMAPFTPFLVEYMYQTLKAGLPQEEQEDSVHFLMLPTVDESTEGADAANYAINCLVSVVDLGRSMRTDKCDIGWKTPLRKATIVHEHKKFTEAAKGLVTYIADQLNARDIEFSNDIKKYAKYEVLPIRKVLGKRLGRKMPKVYNALTSLDTEAVVKFKTEGKVQIEDEEIKLEDVNLSVKVKEFEEGKKLLGQTDGSVIVVLDLEMNDDLLAEGKARDVIQAVQGLRKEAKLSPLDRVDIYFKVISDPEALSEMPKDATKIKEVTVDVGKSKIQIVIVRKKN
eukprot:jgi/Bigna1/58391/fgenesh1_pm.84_\